MQKRWKIIERGSGPQTLRIYTQAATPEAAHKVAVIDIGSGSVKANVYDAAVFPPVSLGDASTHCGLGEGNTPDDPNPHLSATGIDRTFSTAIPAIKALLHKHHPDSIMVICTEAVRAAFANPNEKANVEKFLTGLAHELQIPRETINIASGEMEAHLVIQGALNGDFGNGVVAMMGGGSAEFGEIAAHKQVADHCTTLRFGTRSLMGHKSPLTIVRQQLDNVSWLKKSPDKRQVEIGFLGGVFRCVGRELARRVYSADYTANPQPHHYLFACDASLKDALKDLHTADYASLFEGFFGFKPSETHLHTRHKHIELPNKRRVTRKHYLKLVEEFDKRMGCRAEFIGAASEILLELVDRLEPHAVRFTTHNIRDGAIRDAGLGAAAQLNPS